MKAPAGAVRPLSYEQACLFLEKAAYLEDSIDGGDKTIHFGIDQKGRDFVLIISVWTDKSRLAFI